ncbi:MAG: hypothetical protein AAB364_01605 [Patescibacteria group bacterium]
MSTKRVSSPKTDFKHHAYLVTSTTEVWSGLPDSLLLNEEKNKIENWTFGIIGINEAREIRERGGRASDVENKKFILIWFESITPEAQNVLLKILEEPPLGTVFILGTSNSGLLLPTLLSRLEKLILPEKTENKTEEKIEQTEILDFIKNNPEVRLKYLEKLLDDNEDNHKGVSLDFLNNLEQALAKILKPQEASEQLIFALAEIRAGREHLSHPSGASRLVLQHIALILPVLKQG